MVQADEQTQVQVSEVPKSYLGRNTAAVKSTFDTFWRDYGRPSFDAWSSFLKRYPLTALYLTIVAAIGSLLVAGFIILSALAMVLVLLFASFVSLAIVLFLGFGLLEYLYSAAIFSGTLTCGIVVAYLALRFVTLAITQPSLYDAFSKWCAETNAAILSRIPFQNQDKKQE